MNHIDVDKMDGIARLMKDMGDCAAEFEQMYKRLKRKRPTSEPTQRHIEMELEAASGLAMVGAAFLQHYLMEKFKSCCKKLSEINGQSDVTAAASRKEKSL